ncbi:MAG: formylglycine-generating enzyme family protein [Spirochaetes bacterium]|nr:formylglycine-generating enzyme family protein [Spirochaetota bacterium]
MPSDASQPRTFTVQGVAFKLVPIPAGSFTMGSPEDEAGREKEEAPHPVTLSKPFYMGETPVTQELYQAVMGVNPAKFPGPKRPVEHVSWTEANEFCAKLGELCGARFSLPTEAQWEYACRAGTQTAFSTGAELDVKQAHIERATADESAKTEHDPGETADVASYKPNPWGLYDMHGNVWEWCLDYFGAYPEGEAVDPVGPPAGKFRISRGGAWRYRSALARAALRRWYLPETKHAIVGFRLTA